VDQFRALRNQAERQDFAVRPSVDDATNQAWLWQVGKYLGILIPADHKHWSMAFGPWLTSRSPVPRLEKHLHLTDMHTNNSEKTTRVKALFSEERNIEFITSYLQTGSLRGIKKLVSGKQLDLKKIGKLNSSGVDLTRQKPVGGQGPDDLLFTAYIDQNQTGTYDSGDQLLLNIFDTNADGLVSNGDTYNYQGTYDASGVFTDLNIEDTITNYSVRKATRTASWTNASGSQGVTLTTLLGNGLNGFSNGDPTVQNFYQNLVTPISAPDTLAPETAITYGSDILSQTSGSISHPMLFA